MRALRRAMRLRTATRTLLAALLIAAPIAGEALAQTPKGADCATLKRELADLGKQLLMETKLLKRYQTEPTFATLGQAPLSAAHVQKSIAFSEQVIAGLEPKIALLQLEIWSDCDKTSPSPPLPPTAAKPPVAAPPTPEGPTPDRATYTLRATVQPVSGTPAGECSSRPQQGITAEFLVTNGHAIGTITGQGGSVPVSGTVNERGQLYLNAAQSPAFQMLINIGRDGGAGEWIASGGFTKPPAEVRRCYYEFFSFSQVRKPP